MGRSETTMKAELGWPTGDKPGDARFEYPVADSVRSTVLRVLSTAFPPAGVPEATLHALTKPAGIANRYRLATPDGEWFVRVSMWLGNAALERTLVDYLANKDVPVNSFLIAGVTLAWEDRTYRIDVRPLIHGRHFDNSPDDLRQVVTALVASHRALAEFPQSQRIRQAAIERYQQFDKARERIAAALRDNSFGIFIGQEAWAAEHCDWLAEMVEEFAPRFDLLPGAQCIHGQVHSGNVLFDENGLAVLVDWEEAIHTFAPPAYDLAYFVQRFCLRDEIPDENRKQLLSAVESVYGKLPPLAEIMQQLAWFSIAAIADYGSRGDKVEVRLSEYEKFVRLERQARALIGAI